MSRMRRAVDQLVGGPLDGMKVPTGPGRTLLVPLRIDAAAATASEPPQPRLDRVRVVAEYARPLASGPFYWIRWSPAQL